jgi:hypothetical protein
VLTGTDGEDQHKGGVPCSRRIIQDVTRVVDNLQRIDEAEGGFIGSCGNRNGKRAVEARAVGGGAQRGGRRTKLTAEQQKEKMQRWEHPVLGDVKQTARRKSIDRHNSAMEQDAAGD